MCNVAQALKNKGIQQGINPLVETLKDLGLTNEIIISKVMEKFNLFEVEAKIMSKISERVRQKGGLFLHLSLLLR